MLFNKQGYLTQFFPFIVYYLYLGFNCIIIARFPPDQAMDYLTYGCAFLALIQMAYYYYKNVDLDYIAIGTNLYIIYSAVLTFFRPSLRPLIARVPSALSYYLELGHFPAVFLAIALVGLITTFTSRKGFIQTKGKDRTSVIISSLVLFGGTLGILFVSTTVLGWVSFTIFACPIIAVAIPFFLGLLLHIRTILR